MARRSNFIESNDNFREQNLRFVRVSSGVKKKNVNGEKGKL